MATVAISSLFNQFLINYWLQTESLHKESIVAAFMLKKDRGLKTIIGIQVDSVPYRPKTVDFG